ncbi:MAG TPA: zf-HC2 domain-containing protein [Acidimicrobiia bacterium]|nr:zf-HC2 domain-containing protein [Acidimicrobiia bacterium]
MIGCSEAVRQLWEYLEQDLEEADRAQVEEHLVFCRRCCGELAFAEELRTFMTRSTDMALPPAIAGRLESFLAGLDKEDSK